MFHSKQLNEDHNSFKISDFLDEELMTFLPLEERDAALEALIDLLDKKGKLHKRDDFAHAILEREKIVSTAIGMGIAVPHAKLHGYNKFFIAIGIFPKGIFWDALDQIPVRLVFMIGGPDDQQTGYLQLLSKLTLSLKDPERRKKILQLREAKDIIALFEGI